MPDRIVEFFGDSDNHRKIRYVGFSMAWLGLAVGIAVAIVAGVTGTAGLGFCAAGMLVLSFVLLPVTDINFPNRGYY